MQFRDLVKQYNVLKPQIDKAMVETAASGGYIMGKPVKELEAALAEYAGVRHCISCGNGTDALTLSLKALGIGVGDAVFVADFTFFASSEVISLEGATPVFVDVDEKTFNMDPASLEKKIAEVVENGGLNPKAIIAVDLFGLPANYSEIRKIADRYSLKIIEDGAQGFGGEINGRKACSFGDIATTSFFPAKPLGCYGDGGAVFTDNDDYAALIDSYRVHGKGSFKYDNVRIGVNSRLDSIQAAILLVKFKAFRDYELKDINEAAKAYTERLSGFVETPVIPEGYFSSWAQYTIRLGSREVRDGLQAYMKEIGVPTMVYYPKPMHEQSAYASLGYQKGSSPAAERLCDTVLSLPIHPYITIQDIDTVVAGIKDYLKK